MCAAGEGRRIKSNQELHHDMLLSFINFGLIFAGLPLLLNLGSDVRV